MTNFVNAVNGTIPSDDYLSIFTTNYKNSPYIVKVIITVTRPDRVSIFSISKTIYLNAYIAKFIVPPYNNLKYIKQTETINK